jgi:hypothetical protein
MSCWKTCIDFSNKNFSFCFVSKLFFKICTPHHSFLIIKWLAHRKQNVRRKGFEQYLHWVFFGIITDILLKNPQYFKAKNNIQTPKNNKPLHNEVKWIYKNTYIVQVAQCTIYCCLQVIIWWQCFWGICVWNLLIEVVHCVQGWPQNVRGPTVLCKTCSVLWVLE